MGKDLTGQFGDFVVFGFSQNPGSSVEQKLSHLGITPQTVDLGPAGTFFLYASYGDVAETEDAIGLKVGFARTPGMTSLSAGELLAQKLISPQNVDQDGIRGSAIVACFSKTTPEFSVYQTLFAAPQLYYTSLNGDILCASSQRCLVSLLDRVELNEDILPFHFMFQLAPGPLTYFRNTHRLFPGQRLHWREGRLTVDYVKDMRFSDQEQRFDRVDPHTVNIVYGGIKEVIDTYLNDISNAGHQAATLLSGGVDSSIIQLATNETQLPSTRLRTYSYAVHVPGFEFEVDYAREASRLLGAEHVIVDIWPDDLPGHLCRAIEAISQPIKSEANACKMALAESLASKDDAPRFFLSGQGADCLYGMGVIRKLAIFNIIRQVPASALALKLVAVLLHPGSARIADGLREIAGSLSAHGDPRAFEHWPNRINLWTNLEVTRRSFGDDALRNALEYRRDLEKQYLNSSNLAEQLHAIDLLTEGHEAATLGSQMFLTQGKHMICPFLDEDIMRIAFAFGPQVRFAKPGLGFTSRRHTKYILKQILVQASYASIAEKRKGGTAFDVDLFVMMKNGPLREMVRAIDRPGFLSKSDFEALLEKPDYFLWNLLTFDIFRTKVLAAHKHAIQAPGDQRPGNARQ
jgi:asparagine synthetase B (glutamine-hydrolysing)